MNNESAKFEDLSHLPISLEVLKGNWKSVDSHYHDFTEYIYLVSGKIKGQVNDIKFEMKSGDLAVFHPNDIHTFFDFPDSELNEEELLFYVIKFNQDLISTPSPEYVVLSQFLVNAKNTEVNYILRKEELNQKILKALFENAYNEYQIKDFGYDINIISCINMITTQILKAWHKQGYNIDSRLTDAQFYFDSFDVLKYIKNHRLEDITPELIADECGKCYTSFARNFKKVFGLTCTQYIEYQRIIFSDILLATTSQTLEFISQESRFSDTSHYIKIYKKIKGITPTEYRNRIRQTKKLSNTLEDEIKNL